MSRIKSMIIMMAAATLLAHTVAHGAERGDTAFGSHGLGGYGCDGHGGFGCAEHSGAVRDGRGGYGCDGHGGYGCDGRAGFRTDAQRGPSVGGDYGSLAADRKFDDLESDDPDDASDRAPFDTARCNPDRLGYSARDCPWRQ
jgi:hypothetical protein